MDTQGEDYIAHEIISRAVSIRRFSASEQSKVIEMLKRLEEELLIHLLRKDLTNIGRRNIAQILRQAQEIIAEHYSNISDFVDESLPEFARSEAQFIGDTFGKVLVSIEPSLPTETYFRELMKDTLIQGAPSADWWDRQAGDTAFRFANEVRQGMIQGETVDQITKRVKQNVEPLIENNARATVNTSIQQVAADARRETFKQNDDLIIGIKQISVLDSHTSLTCVAYSGAEWENTADMKPIPPTTLPYNGGIPRHWNALQRGTLVKTADGDVSIEEIQIGDHVVTHEYRFRPVTDVMCKPNDTDFITRIKLANGIELFITDDHPVLAKGRGWVHVDELTTDDSLFVDWHWDGLAQVGIIEIEQVRYCGEVYNLSVLEDESYLANDVVVHNCRSQEVPILKDTLNLNLPPGTRASDIGPISAETTMADFIKMRGRGFADRLLGVGRADLFMSGKMTLTQLLDQSGRPLSLKELNELHK